MIDYLATPDTTIVYDTIYAAVDTLTQSQQVQVYKDILESQQSAYEVFIYLLIGVNAAVGVANWYYNKFRTEAFMEVFTKKLFYDEKEGIVDDIREEHKKDLYHVKGDTARRYAISCESDKIGANCVFWWADAANNYNKANSGSMIELSVDALLERLEKEKKNIQGFRDLYLQLYDNFDSIHDWVDNIPEILSARKKKIKKILDEIENMADNEANVEEAELVEEGNND